MQVIKGNLWIHYGVSLEKVVIPTNIGWKTNGKNVMGAGLAKVAAEVLDPDLPGWYGGFCKIHEENTPVVESPKGMILFPVKPLNKSAPHMSWKQPADLKLIERSTIELAELGKKLKDHRIFVPTVGCGNGGLEISDVRPILEKHLSDQFTLVMATREILWAQPPKKWR